MAVFGINEKEGLLSEVPRPPIYLTDQAKSHYKEMARRLITIKRLKETYLPALEIYSEAMAIWEYSCRKIREENSKEYGSGYTQKFKNNVVQFSTWINLRNKAEGTLFNCFKQFGLDPRSEKDLKNTIDPNQGDLFKQFKNKTHG